jgi:hypothetical protein
MGASFDDLGEHFSEDELLGEIFGADNDAICGALTACDRQEEQHERQERKA